MTLLSERASHATVPSIPLVGSGLRLPADLQRQLYGFRSLIWKIKSIEAVCGAVCGVVVGYLTLFAVDRLLETPQWIRIGIFAFAFAACTVVPVAFHHWIWGHRSFDQLARLLSRRFPSLGDQLLGVIEIVRSGSEQLRSRSLCEAAIGQVAEQADRHDFGEALPRARHRLWMFLAAVPGVAAVVLLTLVPGAAVNAWARFLKPWQSIDRYTFTQLKKLPEHMVVPHGEPAGLVVDLQDTTQWHPDVARAMIGRQRPLVSDLSDTSYAFTLPPQLVNTTLWLAVGDARQRVHIEPMFRPEMQAVVAEVTLPEYLQRSKPVVLDVRGGSLSPVKGSRLTLAATANRELLAASVDSQSSSPNGASVTTDTFLAEEPRQIVIEWEDWHGLRGAKPLIVSLSPRDDELPTVTVEDFPNRQVLLETETLTFKVRAGDDFGIKQVGIEWQGNPENNAGNIGGDSGGSLGQRGERVIASGGSDRDAIQADATFSPALLGIQPQSLLLRVFADDYFPGHRAFSAAYVLYVMDASEHALWVNDQLRKWKQQAGEVRDREMQLLAINEELRDLDPEQIDLPQIRSQIESQASAESANGRRLSQLVDSGGELVRQAMRNPEFEATTLEQLAENLETLKDIAESRMPSVANLLKQAARAPTADAGDGKPSDGKPSDGKPSDGKPSDGKPSDGKPSDGKPSDGKPSDGKPSDGKPSDGQPSEPPPIVGEQRAGESQANDPKPGGEPAPPVPQVVDKESSQQPAAEPAQGNGQPPKSDGSPPSASRLGLPTTIAGQSTPPPESEAPQSAAKAIEGALEAQRQLLEEFAKVADALGAVMSRLEGSTFVKRLKLASREQGRIGGRIAGLVDDAFGRPEPARKPSIQEGIRDIGKINDLETERLSAVMDDMQGYFDRRLLPAFQTVLEEMKELDVLGSIRQLTGDMDKEAGMSIAQTEFWSDTLDRWADDLVPPPPPPPPPSEGGAPAPPRASLPPDVVLEAMRILEDEMNLREETRVTQQGKPAVAAEEFDRRATLLAVQQDGLANRLLKLKDQLVAFPDSSTNFGPEIRLFGKVEEIMQEAAGIMRRPDTGKEAIAAETEAIERLLESQAAGGGGGGGGGGGSGSGTSPGGGGSGSTSDSALTLLGRGHNGKVKREGPEDEQATGAAGRVLPEEFRQGLDAYFNRLEKGSIRP